MNGHKRRQSSESQSVEGNEGNEGNGAGRKSDSFKARAKRNRYISIACNECKRRKIKCNGQMPCQRCGHLSVECLYAPNCCSSSFKDSDEFGQMNAHIISLQDQVNNLYSNISALRNGSGSAIFPRHDPETYSSRPSLVQSDSRGPFRSPTSSSQPRTRHSGFQGPTSSAFNFDVAKSSLQIMGIASPEEPLDENVLVYEEASYNSPLIGQAPMAPNISQSSKDPLWKIEKDEAIRLCRVYDEEMGLMYPILDIEKFISKASMLFTFIESAKRTGLMNRTMSGSDNFNDDDTDILKMVLATALTVEGSGQSDLGRRLFDSVRGPSESKLWEPASPKGLVLLVIVSQYHFQVDEEVQAYRIVGLAVRLCLELGLHRREKFMRHFPDEEERSWAVKLFWSIYVLDHRLSFGTGMPFAVQDADIDPWLPEPDDSSPYLKAMVKYGRISSKVWGFVTRYEGTGNELRKDEMEYLDFQIQQWQTSLPDPLRFSHFENARDTEIPNRAIRRLQVILYLRANNMRISIHRPMLHSATSIMKNRRYAQVSVEVSKDTIRVLTRLNQATNIYRTQQICFNYFLVSALAVLFLAVAHAPMEFNRQVRDEFYMALDLVKGFSTKSYTSKRLWMTIRGLKEVAPKLGLVSRQGLAEVDDPHSSAAVAMAGLAGHHVDELAGFPQPQMPMQLGNSPLNGQQMSHELTNLFEAAGEYGSVLPPSSQGMPGMNGFVGPSGELSQGCEGMSGMFGNEEEFSMIMRDLF